MPWRKLNSELCQSQNTNQINSGVARWTGGALSSSIYIAILNSVQKSKAGTLVPAAAMANGADQSTASALLAAIPLGAGAIANVTGTTPAMVAAAGAAFVESYVIGLRTICLASIGFGVVAIICCCLSNDIGPKMNTKSKSNVFNCKISKLTAIVVEVFLENDVQADKNRFH